jgi:NAD(P)-dependent dehydrogenase (short-subunit alcohol dehydrogenase family)
MKVDSNCAAIVTGGGSGLGAATADELARRGVRVAVFDRDEGAAQRMAELIGGLAIGVDVTDEASLDAAFSAARAAHGQERVLVNCAGIATSAKTVSRNRESGALTAHRLDEFRRTIEINLVGTFACIARAAAGMAALNPTPEGERGVIVNTASIAAEDGQIGQAAYSASKAGVAGMTLPIARDLMSEGIRVNTILPGILSTPMLRGLPQGVQDSLAATVPFPKRLGDPAEYAELVLFLIGNGYMNGATVRLDGALRMAPR